MLNDAAGFRKVYIAAGLSSRYFYSHLFKEALILDCFQEKYEDKKYM